MNSFNDTCEWCFLPIKDCSCCHQDDNYEPPKKKKRNPPRYKVFEVGKKCRGCGEGQSWGILDTTTEDAIGSEYFDKVDAQEECQLLNAVYKQGITEGILRERNKRR
jgi:hypothetical protein